jgi:hypothetical protein
MVSKWNVFGRESAAFLTVTPSIYRLLDEASPGKFQPHTARCLHYSPGPPVSTIVLEDLKEQGFRMADRTAGLDLQHCLLVMRTIARSHAASVVLHHKDPEILKPFNDSLI